MISGVFIAILFGANEDMFKNKIQAGLQKNVKIAEILDTAEREAKISGESSKFWRYYQRFHFHATGIGAMCLSLLLLLAFIPASPKLKNVCAYMIAIGGFLYPFVWLFAALYGPEMGRHEAKEAFQFFGWMGGVFLIGSILEFFLLIKYKLQLPKLS
jgi:hypothetical protein